MESRFVDYIKKEGTTVSTRNVALLHKNIAINSPNS